MIILYNIIYIYIYTHTSIIIHTHISITFPGTWRLRSTWSTWTVDLLKDLWTPARWKDPLVFSAPQWTLKNVWMVNSTNFPCQRVDDLRENLQETIDIPMKYGIFVYIMFPLNQSIFDGEIMLTPYDNIICVSWTKTPWNIMKSPTAAPKSQPLGLCCERRAVAKFGAASANGCHQGSCFSI